MAVIRRPEEWANAKQQVVFARELPWPPIKFNNVDADQWIRTGYWYRRGVPRSSDGLRSSLRSRLPIDPLSIIDRSRAIYPILKYSKILFGKWLEKKETKRKKKEENEQNKRKKKPKTKINQRVQLVLELIADNVTYYVNEVLYINDLSMFRNRKKERKKQRNKKGLMSKEGSRTSYRSRLSIVGEATIWTPPSGFRVKLQRGGYQSNSNEQATLRPGRLWNIHYAGIMFMHAGKAVRVFFFWYRCPREKER